VGDRSYGSGQSLRRHICRATLNDADDSAHVSGLPICDNDLGPFSLQRPAYSAFNDLKPFVG